MRRASALGLCYTEKKIKIGCLTHASRVACQETESLYQVQYSRACMENMCACERVKSFLTNRNTQFPFTPSPFNVHLVCYFLYLLTNVIAQSTTALPVLPVLPFSFFRMM